MKSKKEYTLIIKKIIMIFYIINLTEMKFLFLQEIAHEYHDHFKKT